MVPAFSLPNALRWNDVLADGLKHESEAGRMSAIATSPSCSTPEERPACQQGRHADSPNMIANMLQAEAWYQPALRN